MEQPKAHDPNMVAPTNEDYDIAEPEQRIAASKELKNSGLFPNDYQVTKPLVIRTYSTSPEDIELLGREGYSITTKKDSQIIAKIKTVDDEEVVLVFDTDQENGYKDDDHPAYMWCDAVADHKGWEYKIPIFFYTATDVIEDAEYDNITAEHIAENKKPKMNNNHAKVIGSFNAFIAESLVNEEDTLLAAPKQQTEQPEPCNGCSDHPDTLSESAKEAIKRVCNEVLIKEAHVYETSVDPNQTYETFLRECTHYMAECLIRASQNLKV
jgi:hypothetical protein